MIIAKKRFKGEKIHFNEIKAILINKKKNILIKIDNNDLNYYIIKKKNIYNIKLYKYIYKVIVTDINYHPYKLKIIHIDFKDLND